MSIFNSTAAQRRRILNFLHACTFGTLTIRKELDAINPVTWVEEPRKRDIGIRAIKIDRPVDCGKIPSMSCYVMVAEAVAPAPADKADGIHRKETDKSEHSMEGSL